MALMILVIAVVAVIVVLALLKKQGPLNDRSHASQRAQARDDLLANVCRVIGLPLLTIIAKPAYAIPELRAQFLAATTR
jgi:hypothetical protein